MTRSWDRECSGYQDRGERTVVTKRRSLVKREGREKGRRGEEREEEREEGSGIL